MDHPAAVATITVPLGGQRIELHPIEFVEGSLPLLRVRIREGKRFTIFDIDPGTATDLGEALVAWGRAKPGSPR